MATQTYPKIAPYELSIRCGCGEEVELVGKGGGMWTGTCPGCGASYTASAVMCRKEVTP